jgi:hypothetical protein
VYIQIRSQVLGYAPDALDTPIPRLAHPMRHTIFRDKARGPLGGNANPQPLVDPTSKARIADSEILGTVVKDSLAERFILDAARRQPSTDAPPLVQHGNPHALTVQHGSSNQPGQASTDNDTCLVFAIHATTFLGT